MTEKEVEDLISKAVKNGVHDDLDDLATIRYSPSDEGYSYGIDKMKVVINERGRVITAYPESGKYVDAWNGVKWV
jgi:hypothetical protein